MNQYKTCTKCKQPKVPSEFHKRLSGYAFRCKECTNQIKRDVYAQNPTFYTELSATYRKLNPEKV